MTFAIIVLSAAILALAQAIDHSQYTPNEIRVTPDISGFFKPKIVGGDEAQPHSYPHAAALYINDRTFCGGSVLNANTILTAAHCVDRARKAVVVAGAHVIALPEESQQAVTSSRFTVHENWDRNSLVNDIALVHLDTPLEFNDYVKAINLDDGECTSADLDGTPGTVSGWGSASGNAGSISPALRHANGTLISNRDCRKIFNIIKDTHICLDGDNGHGPCSNDAGGALLGTRNGHRVEVGIVSFVSGWGCEFGFPTVYTRVACFNDWVQKHL